jgi:hypothetical protein
MAPVAARAALIIAVSHMILVGCGSYSAPNSSSNQSSTPAIPSTTPAVIPVTVNPSTDTLGPGGKRAFVANQAVNWTVLDGPNGGTIDGNGVYTAPSVQGIFRVGAVATNDASNSATAIVTVVRSGFSPTGSMSKERLQHTATLLPNGKVLVVGGGVGPDLIDGYYPVPQAELYDPLTGTFSSAGTVTRDSHTATLLPNGKVLIAGGETDGTGTSTTQSAEVYDPAQATSQPTGSMISPREGHTATLLRDGTVLLVGGEMAVSGPLFWQTLGSAELYDPATGTFSSTGNLITPRVFHTATLLNDGTVLITGGFIMGGNTASAEIYDPSTHSFTSTGSMAVARSNGTATLLGNGKVLVVGGATAEIYDPSTRLFSPAGPLNIARTWHTATLLSDGTVLIVGGYPSTPTAEVYNPTLSSFTLSGGMSQARFSHTATLLPDGRVLVTGGANSNDGVHIAILNASEIYH